MEQLGLFFTRGMVFKLSEHAEFAGSGYTVMYNWQTLTPEYIAQIFPRIYEGKYYYDSHTKKWMEQRSTNLLQPIDPGAVESLIMTIIRAYGDGVRNKIYEYIKSTDNNGPNFLQIHDQLIKYHDKIMFSMYKYSFARKVRCIMQRTNLGVNNDEH